MAHRLLQEGNNEEASFPIVCETCLGPNPYVRMQKVRRERARSCCCRRLPRRPPPARHRCLRTRPLPRPPSSRRRRRADCSQIPNGGACHISGRPYTVFRWRPGNDARYKKTIICQEVAKAKNVCQVRLGAHHARAARAPALAGRGGGQRGALAAASRGRAHLGLASAASLSGQPDMPPCRCPAHACSQLRESRGSCSSRSVLSLSGAPATPSAGPASGPLPYHHRHYCAPDAHIALSPRPSGVPV